MLDALITTSRNVWVAITLLVIFAIMWLLLFHEYFLSSFLYKDDAIYIGYNYFGYSVDYDGTPPRDRLEPLIATTYVADGTRGETIDLTPPPSGQSPFSVVDVQLRSSGVTVRKTKPSATFPPTAVTAPGFSIFETGDHYLLSDNARLTHATAPATESARFEIAGCPGRFEILIVNGSFAGLFRPPTLWGEWKLGAGVRQRFWTGAVEDFSVGTVRPSDP